MNRSGILLRVDSGYHVLWLEPQDEIWFAAVFGLLEECECSACGRVWVNGDVLCLLNHGTTSSEVLTYGYVLGYQLEPRLPEHFCAAACAKLCTNISMLNVPGAIAMPGNIVDCARCQQSLRSIGVIKSGGAQTTEGSA